MITKALIGFILGQAAGLLFWCIILYAPVLQWRWRVRFKENLRYLAALQISFKAAAMTIVVSFALILAAELAMLKSVIADTTIAIAAIIAWWFAHSTAVLAEAQSNQKVSLREARVLSASVMGWALAILFIGAGGTAAFVAGIAALV